MKFTAAFLRTAYGKGPEDFEGDTIQEKVSKMMESRCFLEEETGKDFAVYSRGDYRYGQHSHAGWKKVPEEARGRWCKVYFKDGKVDHVEGHTDGGTTDKPGWDGAWSFAASFGD